MNIVAWLVVGALMGWISNAVMREEPAQGMATSILVGVAGSVLGGWLISPILGGATIDQLGFSGIGLLVSGGSAVSLLILMEFVRRETADPA